VSVVEDTLPSKVPRIPCSGLKSATSVTPGACASRSIVLRRLRSIPVWLVMRPTRFPTNGANFCDSSTSMPVRVWPADAVCAAAKTGVWNHGCTLRNTTRTKNKVGDTRTPDLRVRCARGVLKIIRRRNLKIKCTVILVFIRVYLCASAVPTSFVTLRSGCYI